MAASTRSALQAFIDAGLVLLDKDTRMFAGEEAKEIQSAIELCARLISRDILSELEASKAAKLGFLSKEPS